MINCTPTPTPNETVVQKMIYICRVIHICMIVCIWKHVEGEIQKREKFSCPLKNEREAADMRVRQIRLGISDITRVYLYNTIGKFACRPFYSHKLVNIENINQPDYFGISPKKNWSVLGLRHINADKSTALEKAVSSHTSSQDCPWIEWFWLVHININSSHRHSWPSTVDTTKYTYIYN